MPTLSTYSRPGSAVSRGSSFRIFHAKSDTTTTSIPTHKLEPVMKKAPKSARSIPKHAGCLTKL